MNVLGAAGLTLRSGACSFKAEVAWPAVDPHIYYPLPVNLSMIDPDCPDTGGGHIWLAVAQSG